MTVLVLNATFEPINVCSLKRAIVLLLKEKAVVVEDDEGELRSETWSLTKPAVIRLVVYTKIPRDRDRRITRRAVFARDGWSCQYCGSGNRLTIDHVLPRAKGGKHEWTNLVTACIPCNQRKGHHSLREAGMKLRTRPRTPSKDVFIYVAVKVPPLSWQTYLGSV